MNEVERSLSLLVEASRVSPPLRQAVAAVEVELHRLAAEVAAFRAAIVSGDGAVVRGRVFGRVHRCVRSDRGGSVSESDQVWRNPDMLRVTARQRLRRELPPVDPPSLDAALADPEEFGDERSRRDREDALDRLARSRADAEAQVLLADEGFTIGGAPPKSRRGARPSLSEALQAALDWWRS